MRWKRHKLIQGLFRERLHRFGATVSVDGRDAYCSVTNSGRLRELLFPGNQLALRDHGTGLTAAGTKRKTRYSIHLAKFKGAWVSIEANLAPKLLQEAWEKGRVPELKRYDILKAEVPLGPRTRFDFQARNSRTGEVAWIEVKCCTLVGPDGVGRFPDAPSERASKHLRELMHLLKQEKTKSFAVFILQNPLGNAVAPKDDTDPVFGQTLRKAAKEGVTLLAWRAKVTLSGAELDRPVPVLLAQKPRE